MSVGGPVAHHVTLGIYLVRPQPQTNLCCATVAGQPGVSVKQDLALGSQAPPNQHILFQCMCYANDMLNPSQMTRLCVPSSVYQGLWCVLVTCGPSCHTWHVSCQAPAQKAFAAQHMLSIPGVSSKQDLILGSQAPPKTHTRYECMC